MLILVACIGAVVLLGGGGGGGGGGGECWGRYRASGMLKTYEFYVGGWVRGCGTDF